MPWVYLTSLFQSKLCFAWLYPAINANVFFYFLGSQSNTATWIKSLHLPWENIMKMSRLEDFLPLKTLILLIQSNWKSFMPWKERELVFITTNKSMRKRTELFMQLCFKYSITIIYLYAITPIKLFLHQWIVWTTTCIMALVKIQDSAVYHN